MPVKKTTWEKKPVAKKITKKATVKKTSTATEKKPATRKSTKPTRTFRQKSFSYDMSWAKNLVIVESPTKANTIKKFLGSDYAVVASAWHIADLPQKGLGIDIENHFEPIYEVSPDKKSVVSWLKKLTKQAEKVYLATDEDREWEAISWHLQNFLWLKKDTPRIVFHEITKTALLHALENPRHVDMDLVNSQQWRRVLDRIVGFKVSPVLWTKIKRWLSAGRVQSVAVKMIVEREKEIQNFVPVESWKLIANLEEKKSFEIEFSKLDWKNITLANQSEAENILKKLNISWKLETKKDKNWKENIFLTSSQKTDFQLTNIEQKDWKKTPPAPFTTSSLQQAASSRLGRSVKQVMNVAQKLYEQGHITYMRTDSTNLSSHAMAMITDHIKKNYWEKYLQVRKFKSKAWAQEAHEAIRPTNLNSFPSLDEQQTRLYNMIVFRTLASQMAEAKTLLTTLSFVPVLDKSQTWVAKWEQIIFDWFLKLLDNDDETKILPQIEKWKILSSKNIVASQLFSSPPARYSEATLVKKLESEWIWRPSTYAPTISTIQDRGYVELVDKKLVPLDIAFYTTDYLDKNFDDLMDYKFTADLEKKLDEIAEWKVKWQNMMENFWLWLKEKISKANNSEHQKLLVWEKCPKCGWELVYKFSWKSKFIGCDNYPECDYVRSDEKESSFVTFLKENYEWLPCPAWGEIVVKASRFWPFLASSLYPEVKWTRQIPTKEFAKLDKQVSGQICDVCNQGLMMLKKSKRWYFLACSRYPECKNAKPLPKI